MYEHEAKISKLWVTMIPCVQGGRRADLLEAVRQILPAVHCVALPICVYHHAGCRAPPAPLQQEIVAAKKFLKKFANNCSFLL